MSTTHASPANQAVASTLRAAYPIIYIDTWEEERLENILRSSSDDRPVWAWTAAAGFLDGPGEALELSDPLAALQFIREQTDPAIYLCKDMPALFPSTPELGRAVRDTYDVLAGSKSTLVMSYPGMQVPQDVGKEVHVMSLPLPGVEELLEVLREENERAAEDFKHDDDWLADAASAMKGISSNEARDLFRRLVSESVQDAGAAAAIIRDVKAQLMMKENCLEVVPTDLDLEQIGGLRSLKKWIQSRHQLFGRKAQEAGIPPPSGLLMMGVSGCGKSLAAKIIPAAWNLPLVRLDMNLVMSGAWGSPETAWARALHTVETAAPIVLWIDEIENSFGYSNGSVNSGNMTIFSSFLTWMQEKPSDVFVVATANKIEMLPAEMLRKGRFDQLFFLDLPQADARKEILRIHIRNQKGDPEGYDIDHLAELVDGWTAAEIEQMIRAARLDAFYEDREMVYDDMVRNTFRIVPLSKTMAEQINTLRGWSRKRATPAD